ncbi:MAG: HEAT repeat domain-containing protein [Methyloglobulus sp.]|nr:HEAT repeat domain-containing protein [Methyloglobulus sp.]
MRVLNATNLFSCIAFIVAFVSGYYLRDIGFGQQNEKTVINNATSATLPKVDTKKQEAAAISPEVARLIEENNNLTANCNAINAAAQDTGLPDSAITKSAAELLATLDDLQTQKKTVDELQSSSELQQLMMLMQTDPAAQKLVAERFLEVAGTPLGDMYGMALASSGGAEVNAVAAQLLRDGTRQQRLSALAMLGQVGSSQDAGTRAIVLDMLNNDSGADAPLSIAALSTLSRQGGVVSLTEHQDVVDTISPFLHSKDPQLRETSLGILSQWERNSDTALKAFTEAANDTSPQVKMTAIATLGSGIFGFNDVRDTLLSALQNPNEDPGVKSTAQQALAVFPLDDQALKIYKESSLSSNPYENQDGTWHQTFVPPDINMGSPR